MRVKAYAMVRMDEQKLSELLTALAEPTRRKALALLTEGTELCVCELMAALNVSQSRMSRHMAALKAAGLVTDRRDAQWVRYRCVRMRSPVAQRIVDAVLAATKTPVVRSQAPKAPQDRNVRNEELVA